MDITISADKEQVLAGHKEGRYVRVQISAGPSLGEDRPRLSVVFVIDTSLSMAGRKLERVKASLAESLLRLRLDDEFGVIAFSGETTWISSLQSASQEGIQSAISGIAGMEAGGYTDIFAAWEEAHSQLQAARNRIKRVVVVSDGCISAGAGSDKLEKVATARLKGIVTSALAIGDASDTDFLSDLVESGQGSLTRVSGDQTSEILTEALSATLVIGAEQLRLELEFPESVSARILSNHRVRSRAGNLGIPLGDLPAMQSIELYFRVELPPLKAAEKVQVCARLKTADSDTVAILDFCAQDSEPNMACLDTLASALMLEALALREEAKKLEQQRRYDKARAALLDFATRIAEYPQDPRILHVQLMVEQDALNCGKPVSERTIFPMFSRTPKHGQP